MELLQQLEKLSIIAQILNREFLEIPVPLLSENEIKEIITNGGEILNVTFDKKLINDTQYIQTP